MSEQILILQVSAGLALSFLLILLLTRVIEFVRFGGIMFGAVVFGYLVFILGHPSIVRLREIVGKYWAIVFAFLFASFSTIAAVVIP
ncbi:hypothetical protein MUP05_01435 [Candidatus Bathyarchaeota archaeon]|nr:hypothetical protein [Candidatus Bathyarchaeota archaeon]